MSDTLARADRAKALLDNPDLKQAFQNTRDAILRQFQQIPPSQSEQLLKCRERLHLLESVEENLYQAIRDGALERFREQEKERLPFLGELVPWRKKHRA